MDEGLEAYLEKQTMTLYCALSVAEGSEEHLQKRYRPPHVARRSILA